MKRCEIGGCYEQPVEKAHIKSKGAGGSNEKHNIINLCYWHHRKAPDSFHNIGVWSFAELHNLTDRFKMAFELENKLQSQRYNKKALQFRNKLKRICPTCKRSWSKGIIKEG